MIKMNRYFKDQLYGYIKWQSKEIAQEIFLTWLRRRNLKKETDSLLIAAQNKAIRTSYI